MWKGQGKGPSINGSNNSSIYIFLRLYKRNESSEGKDAEHTNGF